MPSDASGVTTNAIDRRTTLRAIAGGASAAGLAGCFGDDDGDDSDSGSPGGEAVPTVVIEYWANLGSTTELMRNAIERVAPNIEQLGIDVDIEPVEFLTQFDNMYEDKRTHHISFSSQTSTSDRLDPDELLERFTAENAGADGPNNMNYANCEYSHAAVGQRQATSEDERQDLVNQAIEIGGNDAYMIPFHSRVTLGAYRPDAMEIDGVGEAGLMALLNPNVVIKSSPVGDDTLIGPTNPVMLETPNYLTVTSPMEITSWNHLVHSPLLQYDENYELQNILAESIDEANDGRQITVTLRDGTFHNGDPITAEDVQFTFEHLDNHSDVYPGVTDVPFDEINVIDDSTVEFNLESTFRPIYSLTFARWGILHKDTWVDGGAPDDPEGFEFDPKIGSGPFEVSGFDREAFLELSPHDGHPVQDPDHDLVFQVFRDNQSLLQAFQNGEVDWVEQLAPAARDTLDQLMGDDVEVIAPQQFTPFYLAPQFPMAPGKFWEFREAVGKVIDRQTVHDVVFRGTGSMLFESCIFNENHPWRPPDEHLHTFTDEPTGDVEAARQILADEGWGWDDDDRLHYPDGADLSPLWPGETNPTSEQFPCLDDEGNLDPDYEP